MTKLGCSTNKSSTRLQLKAGFPIRQFHQTGTIKRDKKRGSKLASALEPLLCKQTLSEPKLGGFGVVNGIPNKERK